MALDIAIFEFVAAAFDSTIAEVSALPVSDFEALYALAIAEYPCGTLHIGPCLSDLIAANPDAFVSADEFFVMVAM